MQMTSCKNVTRSNLSLYVFPYEYDDCDIRTNDGQLSKNDISFFRRLELECVGNIWVPFHIDLTNPYTKTHVP